MSGNVGVSFSFKCRQMLLTLLCMQYCCFLLCWVVCIDIDTNTYTTLGVSVVLNVGVNVSQPNIGIF